MFREYFDPSQVWRKFSQDVTDDIEIVLDDPKALAKAHGTVRVESDGIKYFVYIKKRQCVDCDTGQVTRSPLGGIMIFHHCRLYDFSSRWMSRLASFIASGSLSHTFYHSHCEPIRLHWSEKLPSTEKLLRGTQAISSSTEKHNRAPPAAE